jgi:organic radical activating enzyme
VKKLNIPIIQFRDQLNEISPSFCVAKWKQVTMHLQTGMTHSCHHPSPHKIPLAELAENPSALHNTKFKKLQRKAMLEGDRPAECDYCWRVEDSGPEAISDRVYKSADAWALPHIDAIKEMPWDHDVIPSYLEVSFSSVCNFKCSYCSPQVSSKWMEETEKYGPYPTSTYFGGIDWLKRTDAMPIPHKDENPYVEAFWKWWPEVYTKLEHFRITGGEPLLTKDLWKVLDYVIDNPNPNLHLSINTNMCPPDKLMDKFIEKIKIICTENKVKQFKIFTSAEAHGKQAEYIRHGLNYDEWLANIIRVLDEVPNCTFTIMSTYNLLSIFTYDKFIEDILTIKRKYSNEHTVHSPIILDVPYLRHPEHQTIFDMPEKFIPLIHAQVSLMHQNVENSKWAGTANKGFYQWEADKFKRIYELAMNLKDSPTVTRNQSDFIKFVDEHDLRRGTNFLKTFPEMTETYYTWKAGIDDWKTA